MSVSLPRISRFGGAGGAGMEVEVEVDGSLGDGISGALVDIVLRRFRGGSFPFGVGGGAMVYVASPIRFV